MRKQDDFIKAMFNTEAYLRDWIKEEIEEREYGNESDIYEYIRTSYVNGQKKQVKELFLELPFELRKKALNHLTEKFPMFYQLIDIMFDDSKR